MRYQVSVEGRLFDIEITPDGQVWVDNRPLHVDLEKIDGLPLYSLLIDHRSYEAHVEANENGDCHVVVAGQAYKTSLGGEPEEGNDISRSRSRSGPLEIRTPLPGWLLEVKVIEGEMVDEGDEVAILESMKMHMILRTPQSGIVHSLRAEAGREVAQGDVLAVIVPSFSE